MRKLPIHPPSGWLRTGLVLSLLTGGAALAQTTTVTFNVNTLRDTQDVSAGDGNCRDENGQCSIRASVMEANGQASRNDKLTFVAKLPAGNYGFSIMGTNETDSRTGDLNFRGGMNFTFEGESQQGTVINLNGIDRFARLGRYERLTLRNLTIKNGITQEHGGAIQVDDGSGATLVAEQVTFSRNQSNGNGGAINSGGTAVLLRNVTFEQNRSQQSGGGLLLYRGNNQLENVVFRGNSAQEAGGLWNRMPLNASKLTFEANTATERAGGLSDTSGALFLRDSVFTGNTSQKDAGGAYIQQGTLERVLFQKNRAVQAGGGLYTERGNVNLLQSGFLSNEAEDGGGLYIVNGARLENLTFSENRATSRGSGIFFYRNQSSLSNSTLALGQSLWGSVYMHEASLILKNSIIHTAKGRACGFYNGNILSSSFNLVNDGTCGLQGEGDLQRTDPRLAPLQTFEGLPVHLPLPDSPALNAVDPTLCALNDQRDIERPQGGNCDIGAVEITAADVESVPEDVQAIVPGAIADFRVLVDNWDDNFTLSVNGEEVLNLSCCGNDRDPYIMDLGSLLKPGVNTLRYTLDDMGGGLRSFKLQLFAGDQLLFWQECYTDQPCFNQSGQDNRRIVQDQALQVVLTPDLKVQVDDRLAEQVLTQLPRGTWVSSSDRVNKTLSLQPQIAVGQVALELVEQYSGNTCVIQLIRTPNQGDALTFDEKLQAGNCLDQGKYQLKYRPEKDQMLLTYFRFRSESHEFRQTEVFDRKIDPPSIESFTATPTQGTVPLKVTARFKVQNPSGLPMECEVQVTSEQRYRIDCLASSVEIPLEKAGTYDLQLNVRYNNQLVSKPFRVVAQAKTEQSSLKSLGLPAGARLYEINTLQFDPQGKPVVAFTRNRQIFLSRWNGQAWQALGTALPAPSRSDLDLRISSLVLDGQGFPVVSTFEMGRDCGPCGYANVQVRRWTGKNWQVLGKVGALELVKLQVDPKGKIYLMGNTKGMDLPSVWQAKVLAWDGQKWVSLGNPSFPKGTVGTLLFQSSGRPMVMLERYTSDDGYSPYRVSLQQWDGKVWQEVKNSQMRMEATDSQTLTLGDRKLNPYNLYTRSTPIEDTSSVTHTSFVQRWTGSTWEKLGTVDQWVEALLFDGSNRPLVVLRLEDTGVERTVVRLYVGGSWRTIGNLGDATDWFVSGKQLLAFGKGENELELQILNLP